MKTPRLFRSIALPLALLGFCAAQDAPGPSNSEFAGQGQAGAPGEVGADRTREAPHPPPYRRPSLEEPLFNRDGLSLDKDQTLDLAELLASVVTNHTSQGSVADNDFRAQALGIALRLDPRNRTAVVANGLLDGGQNLRPTSQDADFSRDWQRLDAVVRWMHGSAATVDDRVLALFLGDLTRRMRPEAGFGPEYTMLHEHKDTVDWSPILRPLPKSQRQPPRRPVEPSKPDTTDKRPPDQGVARAPDLKTPVKPQGDKIRIPPKLPEESVSMPTLVLAGGQDSRATLRLVTLQWDEWGYNTYKNEFGTIVREKIFPKNDGPTNVKFQGEWWQLQDAWDNRVRPALQQRYDSWPRLGVVEVSIPNFKPNNGSGTLLATAICFESMARGLALDPKVAAVGTFSEGGLPAGPSHIPGIVLGFCRGWCDVLLVGAGSMEKLKPLAEYGLASPFLDTQIIEVADMNEAMAVATGKPSQETAKAIADFKAIQQVRQKMDAAQMLQNRFVAEKISAIAAAFPQHLSAALLKVAADHQNRLDFPTTMAAYIRIFALIEQLAIEDLKSVSQEEGLQTLALFNERLREIKPRMDPRVDRFRINLEDAVRGITESLRIKDRSTPTADLHIKGVQQQVKELREALNRAAGR